MGTFSGHVSDRISAGVGQHLDDIVAFSLGEGRGAVKSIAVCMKQVLDPEMPLSLFRIDPETKSAVPARGVPPVLNPFDENALEAALRIKDEEEAKVTVVTLGRKVVRTVVTATLAAGADELLLLEDASFNEFDPLVTASALAAAIRKTGPYDLVLCGLQAADTNAGLVPIGIASLMGVPCLTSAREVRLEADTVVVVRSLTDGYEVLEAPCPAVVTVTYEVGSLREPGVEAFLSAGTKPITVWGAADLEQAGSVAGSIEIVRMEVPVRESRCEILVGESPQAKAEELVRRLQQARVI